jgi:hypothetical protein
VSNNSIVEHRGSYHFVALREEYIVICMNCSYKKQAKDGAKSQPKASPHCKALIIDILEHWMNTKRGNGQDTAIYMTYPQWIKAMYGMFGRNVIIDSLDELVGEGLIFREPHKIYGKDTYKYRLNYKELNRRIKLLPERDPDEESPQFDAFTSKPDKANDAFTSKRDAFTSKPDTRLLVNDDAFTKGRNVDTYIDSKNIDTTERKNDASQQKPNVSSDPTLSHSFIQSSQSFSKGLGDEGKPLGEGSKGLEIVFTPEEEQIYAFAKELKLAYLKKDVKHKESCAKLISEGVTTKQQLDSLMQFCWSKPYLVNDDGSRKALYLKNLATELDGWLQVQQQDTSDTGVFVGNDRSQKNIDRMTARAAQLQAEAEARAAVTNAMVIDDIRTIVTKYQSNYDIEQRVQELQQMQKKNRVLNYDMCKCLTEAHRICSGGDFNKYCREMRKLIDQHTPSTIRPLRSIV